MAVIPPTAGCGAGPSLSFSETEIRSSASAPRNFLFVVPNRAGIGEMSTAMELRKRMERASAEVHCFIITKLTSEAQHCYAKEHLRSTDIIWTSECESEPSRNNLARLIKNLHVVLAIQLPYPDPDMAVFLEREEFSFPMINLCEYEGPGLALGLSKSKVGVLVDREALLQACSGKDQAMALTAIMSSSLKKEIGPVFPGHFSVSYCHETTSIEFYLEVLAELAFKIQKKKHITLVIAGPVARCLPIEKLAKIQARYGIRCHVVSSDSEELADESDRPILRIVPYFHLPQDFLRACYLATSDLPCMATGDGSLTDALCSLSVPMYECFPHKKNLWNAFEGALLEAVPEVRYFRCDAYEPPAFSAEEVAVRYDEAFSAESGPWKARIQELLRTKDAGCYIESLARTTDFSSFAKLGKMSAICVCLQRQFESQNLDLRMVWPDLDASIEEKAELAKKWLMEADFTYLFSVCYIIGSCGDKDLYEAHQREILRSSLCGLDINDMSDGLFMGACDGVMCRSEWLLHECLKNPLISTNISPVKKDMCFAFVLSQNKKRLAQILLGYPDFLGESLIDFLHYLICCNFLDRHTNTGSASEPCSCVVSMRELFFHPTLFDKGRVELFRRLRETLLSDELFCREIEAERYRIFLTPLEPSTE